MMMIETRYLDHPSATVKGVYKEWSPKFLLSLKVEREYLTKEEEKVFVAWEKYAKEHPVKE